MQFPVQNARNHIVCLACLFVKRVNTINAISIRIETIIRRLITQPIERRDETGKSEGQSENTGQRLCLEFPHITESDFQIKCKHDTI